VKSIRQGSRGPAVIQWQTFLRGRGLYLGAVDGDFGPKTDDATRAFQAKHGLKPDGWVGGQTYGKALLLGFGGIDQDPADTSKEGANWPPKPAGMKPLTSNAARARVFGRFGYEHAPTATNPEKVTVLDNWARENIVRVELPELGRTVRFHRLAAPALQRLVTAWDKAGLLDLVLTRLGTYSARYVRGSRKTLSNHAFGSAFDLNVRQNRIGHQPALVGQHGSVRELVPLANKHGFYWGGHFSRLDGMHFEATAAAVG